MKIALNKKNIFLSFLMVAFLAIFGTVSCDISLLGLLSNNELEVRLKGTYASNSPADWSMPATSSQDFIKYVVDDSVSDYLDISTIAQPTKMYLDIAEMRLLKSDELTRLDDSNDKFLDRKFANYRQTYSIDLNSSDFFNGTGIVLSNDDPIPDITYNYLLIYLRKIVFDKAKKYPLSGDGFATSEDSTVDFQTLNADGDFDAPVSISGFDTNQLLTQRYYDTLLEDSSSVNKVFPLIVPIENGFTYNRSNGSTVLEVRLYLKNFLKLYEYSKLSDTSPYIVEYYGPSDALWDVNRHETVIGGNLLGVARSYVKEKVGTISGTNNTGNPIYVIALPAGSDASSTEKDIANYVSSGSPRFSNPCNLPPAPVLNASGYIDTVLNYYIDYENYLYKWNSIVGGCPDFTTYQTKWNDAATTGDKFRLPPLATYVSAGATYSLTNVASGDFAVYYLDIPNYGELFHTSHSVSNVTVPEKGTVALDIN